MINRAIDTKYAIEGPYTQQEFERITKLYAECNKHSWVGLVYMHSTIRYWQQLGYIPMPEAGL